MSSIVLNKYKIQLTTIKRRGPAKLFVHTRGNGTNARENDYLYARVLICLRDLLNEICKIHRVHEGVMKDEKRDVAISCFAYIYVNL